MVLIHPFFCKILCKQIEKQIGFSTSSEPGNDFYRAVTFG